MNKALHVGILIWHFRINGNLLCYSGHYWDQPTLLEVEARASNTLEILIVKEA